jgi:hypothetical protein
MKCKEDGCNVHVQGHQGFCRSHGGAHRNQKERQSANRRSKKNRRFFGEDGTVNVGMGLKRCAQMDWANNPNNPKNMPAISRPEGDEEYFIAD